MIDPKGVTIAPDGKKTYDMTRVESYTYYSNGLLKEKKDKNGNITANIYDIFGRVLKTTCGEDTISYTYDNNGNTKTIADSTGITVRTYDKLGRVLMKSVPKVGVMTYQYDITEDIEAGNTAEKSIDARGNTVLKISDQLGRLDTVISDGNTTTFTYDANGNKESVIYSEGGSEEYTYYDSNQLHTLTNKKEDGTILDTYIYTYDQAGNQLTKTDQAGTTTYGYDCLNRLERVLESDGIGKSYLYDGAGNRLREIVINDLIINQTTYTYNEQNRLMQTQSKSEEGAIETIKYTYDANGNQTYASKELLKPASPMNKPSFGMFIVGQTKPEDNPIAGYQRSFKYDKFNQMIYAANGGTASEFAYNGEGLRVSSKVNGKVTKYVYEADKVVLELNEKGLQTAKNVYGDNRLISRTVEDEIAYYFFNGHGDVTALVNNQGAVIANYSYDAFGNPKEKTGEVDNPYRYAGYQYDEGTGLYYLKARMYDPITARFMQEDSYLGKGNDPLSLNRYTYCHNEPVRYLDPNGHWDIRDIELNSVSQAKIIALTNAYYSANSNKEREAIHQQAEVIRNNESNKDTTIFANDMNKTAISINKTIIDSKKGNITKNEWDTTIESNGISYVSNPPKSIFFGSPYNFDNIRITITSFDKKDTNTTITVETNTQLRERVNKGPTITNSSATLKVSDKLIDVLITKLDGSRSIHELDEFKRVLIDEGYVGSEYDKFDFNEMVKDGVVGFGSNYMQDLVKECVGAAGYKTAAKYISGVGYVILVNDALKAANEVDSKVQLYITGNDKLFRYRKTEIFQNEGEDKYSIQNTVVDKDVFFMVKTVENRDFVVGFTAIQVVRVENLMFSKKGGVQLPVIVDITGEILQEMN